VGLSIAVRLVERCVDLGASPRATICWGRLVKVWALLMHEREEVYPEDVQALAATSSAIASGSDRMRPATA
jgi:hypothetical protein